MLALVRSVTMEEPSTFRLLAEYPQQSGLWINKFGIFNPDVMFLKIARILEHRFTMWKYDALITARRHIHLEHALSKRMTPRLGVVKFVRIILADEIFNRVFERFRNEKIDVTPARRRGGRKTFVQKFPCKLWFDGKVDYLPVRDIARKWIV